MNVGLVNNTYSGLTKGSGAFSAARQNADAGKLAALVEKFKAQESSASENAATKIAAAPSGAQVVARGRLNGDYTSGFAGTYVSQLEKNAKPAGAAVNQAAAHGESRTIDKTSELYEKSLELENYFVKQMLSEMRKSVHKTNEGDFASKMYEDMLYDEYSTAMTKNAGFGLADQIYLALV